MDVYEAVNHRLVKKANLTIEWINVIVPDITALRQAQQVSLVDDHIN